MGPNGSGKSTLARVLAGHPGYEVTGGEVLYNGKDLLEMPAEERAREGVFLAFQYPVEIPGVNNAYFLKAALNADPQAPRPRRARRHGLHGAREGEGQAAGHGPALLKRPVNEGFSGGEKKRNEIFQMAVLEPTLAILDETDSGLDIDALRIVAERRQRPALPRSARSSSSPTTSGCSNYIVPDFVHVLSEGRIVQVGRQGAGARARGEGLRLDVERRHRRPTGRRWRED